MKKKLVVLLSSLFLVFVSAFVPVFSKGFLRLKSNAFTTSDTTSFVRVSELWKGDGFNETNLNRLLKLVSGDISTDTINMDAIYSQAETKKTAYQMRNQAILEKTTSQNIVVTMGGLDWTLTYLSKDTDGNVILTMWLTHSEQLSGKPYDIQGEGEEKVVKTFNASGTSTFNSGYTPARNPGDPYPDNMYGTSYVRAVTLNNGGTYITASAGVETATYEKSEENVFANFTMPTGDGGSIADFIITPSKMIWQKTGQYPKEAGYNCDGNRSNENWWEEEPDEKYGGADNNYARKFPEVANVWKNDLLWLPSHFEIGSIGANEARSGLWSIDPNQRVNIEQWTRSAVEAGCFEQAVTSVNNGSLYKNVNSNYGIRPAFHFNLTKAVSAISESGQVDELWNSETNSINEDNFNLIYKYLTGNENANYEDVVKLLDGKDTKTLKANEIKDLVYKGDTISKKENQDITIKLGGYDWTATYLSFDKNGNAILTLWLDNSFQLNGKIYDNEKTFNEVASATWNSGFSPNNNVASYYPDNMYGLSYIRSAVLNNGGIYSTASGASSVVNFEKNEDSAFAMFTIPQESGLSLTDFIVTPKYVSWQEEGQMSTNYPGTSRNFSNENWSKRTSDSGFINGNINYAKRMNSDYWKNDYIWLPSVWETGYNTDNVGIWDITENQKKYIYDTWTRSGCNSRADWAYVLPSANQIIDAWTNSSRSVKPALHLNLNYNAIKDFVENGEEENIKDNNSYVEVDELWNNEENKFYNNNLTELYKYLLGNDNVSYGNIYNIARNVKTSKEISEISYANKTSGKDIVVTLGGLKWTVTYLSTDKNGEAILTLWLNDSSDISNGKINETLTLGKNGLSSWNSGFIANDHDYCVTTYPSNMYSTSFIRSVVLNNGGGYITQNRATALHQVGVKSNESMFAPFTITSNNFSSIADYLVSPRNISWQEQNQLANTKLELSYNLSNENYSNNIANTNFFTNSYPSGSYYNYAGKTNNDAWADDLVWLPSLTEVGFGDKDGIWAISKEQRNNIYNYWLRSSSDVNAYEVAYLSSNGVNYGFSSLNKNFAIRPAIHLNLNKVILSSAEINDNNNYAQVGELWDSSTKKIDSSNLNTLIKYITGNNSVGYSELLKLANKNANANDFRKVVLGDKTDKQDILLTLGGLDWTATYLSSDKKGNAILTLWLASDYQSAWQSNSYASGEDYYILDGFLKSKFSSWQLNGASIGQYPDSMYGSSYIRAITLNNGGTYTTNTNTALYASKNAQNAFANFTMSVDGKFNDITDFLVTPSNIKWQETQSFYNIYNTGNNYSNEAWLNTMPATNFVTNYAGRIANDNWKNDYLWLPSYSEINSTDDATFWGLSENQLNSYTEEYYLRSFGDTPSNIFTYNNYFKDVINLNVCSQTAVRPAMHLNLTAIIESLNLDDAEDGSKIYLDTENGNDLYDGTSFLRPVKTIEKAEELVANNGVIEIMNKVTILQNTVLGKNKSYTLKRWVGGEYVAGYWETLLQIGNYTSSDNKSFANLTLNNVVINGNGVENTNLSELNNFNTIAIDVNYGNLIFNNKSGLANFNSKIYAYIVYLRHNESIITINNGIFTNNIGGNLIYSNSNNASIVINGGVFENNLIQDDAQSFNSLINGGNIKIKSAEFKDNSVTNGNNLETINDIFSIINVFENGNLKIEDSLFKNNLGGIGGVVYANFGVEITFINSDFINNLATLGGVIALKGNNQLNIRGGIFETNKALAGGVIFGFENNFVNIIGATFNNNEAISSYPKTNETEEVNANKAETLETVSYSGGGVILLNSNNNLNIGDSNFNNNKANESSGGAIYVNGNNQNISILNSNFNGNNSAVDGGSVFIGLVANDTENKIEIKNSNFENSSTLHRGGAIYFGENLNVDLSDCYFKSNKVISTENGCGGAIYGGSANNSSFENNTSTYFGGALYKTNSYSCTFKNNSAYSAGAMFEGEIINSTFISNFAQNYGGAVVNPVNVYASTFVGNIAGDTKEGSNILGLGGAIYNNDKSKVIENSIFSNNVATENGGAIYNNIEGDTLQNLQILNSEFTFNFAKKGSAIYNNGELKLSIIGDVSVTNNVTSESGAIYFAGNAENEISEIIFGDKLNINNIYIYNNFKGVNITEFEKDENGNFTSDNNADNLFIDFDNGGDVKITLASNLVGGSKIGINVNSFINDIRKKDDTTDEYKLLIYETENDILTSATTSSFVSDDLQNAKFYTETLYNGNTKIGLGIFIKLTTTTSNTIVYTASDYYGFYDGNTHTVDIQVFVPVTDYTIWYSETENGEYSKTPITVRDAGESLTVWFYIEANGYATTNKDSRNIAINKMNIYYDESDININLWFGLSVNSKSDNGTIINKFVNTSILDEDGNAVSCDFILYANSSNEIINKDNYSTSRVLDIIPKNTEKYKSVTGLMVNATVLYDSLYYSSSNFYPNEEEMIKGAESMFALSVTDYNLNNIIPYVKNSGIVCFADTYSVSSNISLIIENKIEFRRCKNYNSSIINIANNGNLKIEVEKTGKLTIKGNEKITTDESATAMIINNGNLQIFDNVLFEDCYNYNSTTVGGAILSTGTLYLDGTIIKNCVSSSNGGGIYASGKTTLINVRVENCKAVLGAGVYLTGESEINNCDLFANYGLNSSTADTKAVKGVGLYIASGEDKVIISDSRITYNKFNFITSNCYGGGVFVESGNVEFLNTDISFNESYIGGGLYVATSSDVESENLRIEGNTLANGTTGKLNEGAGVYIEENATFTMFSGLIRSNGTSKTSATHNIIGIGISCYGTFNFAEYGDTTSQITLNSDKSSTQYGSGMAIYGTANIYGGNISQNFNSSIDNNLVDGVLSLGGTLTITGANFLTGKNSFVNVLDNWENLNTQDNRNFNVTIYIYGNRSSVINPIIVKGDENYVPTWDEWYAISDKIDIIISNSSYIKPQSTRTLSHDAILNEYLIYYKTPMANGRGIYYFNPSTGNDLNAGTAVGTALKTWDAVVKKSNPGDTIFINATWQINDDYNIDGEGRVLRKLYNWAGTMIQIVGTYVPVVSIKNLILDGNKRKHNGSDYTITEFDWGNYLNGGYALLVSVSCKISLKNVIVRDNSCAYGAVYIGATDAQISFSAIDCEFLNNTNYLNSNGYSTVFSIRNTNTSLDLYLYNCVFDSNDYISSAYYYWAGICMYFESGTHNVGTTQNIDIINCKFTNNYTYNINNSYTTYGKLFTYGFNNLSEKETVNLTFDGCEITNNKDRTKLSKSNESRASGIIVYCQFAKFNFNFLNCNYSKNFSFYSLMRFAQLSTTNTNKANIRIENCVFEDNEYFLEGIICYNWADIFINNCKFSQQFSGWAIYLSNALGGDITINNCEFNNCLHNIYTHQGARNITITNIISKNNGWADVIRNDNFTGTLFISNVYVTSAHRLLNIQGACTGEIIIRDCYIEDTWDGIYLIPAASKSIYIENFTVKNAKRSGIFSNGVWNDPRTIVAKNVKISNVVNDSEGDGLFLRYTDFIGEDIYIDSCLRGVNTLGGYISNLTITSCYSGILVHDDAYRENYLENISISNCFEHGIYYAYSSQARLPHTFKNIHVFDCRGYAFFDYTISGSMMIYSNNLTFENCLFERCSFGFYRWVTGGTSYNNIDTTTFINCIIRDNKWDGAAIGAHININSSISITYNFINCLITGNGRYGIFMGRDGADRSGPYPNLNIDKNTVISHNLVGLYMTGAPNQTWGVITGGHFVDNITYGIYQQGLLWLNGNENTVVVKRNGINSSGEKIYKDVYSTRTSLSGSLDVESILCSTGGNGIYIRGSLEGTEELYVYLTSGQAVNSVFAQGVEYNATEADFSKFKPTNWSFKINENNSNQLLLASFTGEIKAQPNVYYFDPSRNRDGDGLLPTTPISKWSELEKVLNPEGLPDSDPNSASCAKGITVYMLNSFTLNNISINAHGAKFAVYVDPSKTTLTWAFNESMFKVISGICTINNIVIDGNSNFNGNTSASISGLLNLVTESFLRGVQGAIALINGNSTLRVNNCYVSNLYCNNAFRLESGSNNLYLNKCVVENVYCTDAGFIYSQGNLVSITESNFSYMGDGSRYIIYCDNLASHRLIVDETNFNNYFNAIWFNGTHIEVTNCNFSKSEGTSIYIYNSKNNTSKLTNCKAEYVSYFLFIYGGNIASYITLTDVEVHKCWNYAFQSGNTGYIKTVTGTNVITTECQVGFQFWQNLILNITNFQSINNICGIGLFDTTYRALPNVSITLDNSKFINNHTGFYYYYYNNNNMVLNLTINNSIFENITYIAIYLRYYNYYGHYLNSSAIRLTDVKISNCPYGIYSCEAQLVMTRCKVTGITSGHAVYYRTYHGTLLQLEFCEFSNIINATAVYTDGGVYSRNPVNIYVYYCNFSNNRYGSVRCYDNNAYIHIYIADSSFDKSSGSPYNSAECCSVYAGYSVDIRVWGLTIIEAGIFSQIGYGNIRIHSTMHYGSYIRLFINRQGNQGDTVASSNGYGNAYLSYFHVDGWNLYNDGNNIRLLNYNSYMVGTGDSYEDGTTALYFNPVSGNDANNGHSYLYPVKTWKRIEELNKFDWPVYLMSNWNINESTTIDGHGWILYRYYDKTAGKSWTGNLIIIDNLDIKVTIKNLTIHGNMYCYDKGITTSTNGDLVVNAYSLHLFENASLLLQNCKIESSYTTTNAVCLNGNFRAENCEFNTLYCSSANISSIYVGSLLETETSFINCSFINCGVKDSSSRDNVKTIHIAGENKTINIESCYIEGCYNHRTTQDSGIIFIEATNSVLNIIDLNCWNNNTSKNVMSGVYVNSASCKVNIDDSRFVESYNNINNTGLAFNGGAIYIATDAEVTITNCLFENYKALKGAGIYITNKTENASPNIVLNNLIFKDCFSNNTENSGGAIYIDTTSVVGGVFNINNIKCYYVNTCFGAIGLSANGAEIKIQNVLVDGSNYSYNVGNNANAININGVGDCNIVINKLIVNNCVDTAIDIPTIYIHFDEENNSETKINNLEMNSNRSAGSLVKIQGTNLEISDSNFIMNNAKDMLSFGVNYSVKINNINFVNNIGGFAIFGDISENDNYEISNINITNNYNTSGIKLNGVTNNSSNGNIVIIDNVNVLDNRDMPYGMYLEKVNAEIKNSKLNNNTLINSNITSVNSNLVINNSYINNNTVTEIGNELSDDVFISRGIDMFVEMPEGNAYSAGAISSYGGKLKLNFVDVIGNTSVGFGGGIVSCSPISIENSNINNNKAGTFGGGLIATMDVEIYNSNINSNSANTNGGGIWFGALLKLINVKLEENISYEDGSAIYSYGKNANLTILNSSINKNISYGNGGVYFVNDRGSVDLHGVKFIANSGFGKGAALYLNSLIFNESDLVFSGNQIYGTLINFEDVANFAMSDFVVSGNYGYGENATLFSFTTNRGAGGRLLFTDARIYGNKMEYNASVVIDDGLYVRMTNVEVTGNSNLFSGDLSSGSGKGGAIYVKNGTLVLEEGVAVDNWAEYGAWLYVGEKGKAIITSQEISNISTDAETVINGVIYVERNGELELHSGNILGISLSTLKGAINNNGHTVIVDSKIYDNSTTNSIIYNGETGVINLEGVEIYSNKTTNGGAIYNLGAINFVSGVIRNNTATLGGAIYNEGNFTLSGGTVSNNAATRGGAVYNKGNVTLNSGLIINNMASVSGGGIYNDESAIITMLGGTVSNNSKSASATSIVGSAIANYGSVYIYGGEISNNGSEETGNGGGIYFGVNSQGYIENATISKNLSSPTSSGSNIYLDTNSYLLIKNSTLISGRVSSNNATMDINVNSATLILDNVKFICDVASGVLKTTNSNITLINSNLSNLKPNESGASIYISGGNLLIENITIENAGATTDSVLHLDNVNSFNINKSSFENNNSRAIYIDVSKVATVGTFNNVYFNANNSSENGGAIIVMGSESNKVNANILIQNTTFTRNVSEKSGGAIYLGSAYGAVVNVYNSTFGGFIDKDGNGYYDAGANEEILGNYAYTNGGAIYITEINPASLVLKGEVSITYNSTDSELGGGIYNAFAGEVDYNNGIYGLSLQSGSLITIQYNYIDVPSVSDIARASEDNLHFTTNSNKGILVAELSTDSYIGVTLENVEENLVAITSYKADIPVTTRDLKVFSYDGYDYKLKLDVTRNSLIIINASAENNVDIVVQVSDKVYTVDGESKSLTSDDFVVFNCRNYKILYSTDENGEFVETSPKYSLKGEYTIWYKIVDNQDAERFVKGSITLKITGKILSIEEIPTAYINSGEKLSTATFEFGIVKSGDNIVSGKWVFNDGNIIPSNINTRYTLTFIPSNSSLYENTVSVLVNPIIAYSKVYYFENSFYTNSEHTQNTGINSLATMVSYLKDMGEIYFMSSYTVGANGVLEEIVTSNKKIYLSRYITFVNDPMIILPVNIDEIIKLSIGGGEGSIYIDCGRGSSSRTETEPLFVNNGLLSLGNNVYIRNISNTGGGPAVAHNTKFGTLNLNGCDIYSTFVDINTTLLTGGSIYNEGTMTINGGDYRLNYCTNGNGGFIYNTGKLTINSGLFARNYSTNGVGGCIYTKGGSVIFNGGDFIGNRAVYGGVIYVTDDGQTIINGANFYSNVASEEGASVYNDNGKVIQNGGDFKYNVNLSLKNSNKEITNKKFDNKAIIIISVLLSVIIIFGAVTFVFKKRKIIK